MKLINCPTHINETFPANINQNSALLATLLRTADTVSWFIPADAFSDVDFDDDDAEAEFDDNAITLTLSK